MPAADLIEMGLDYDDSTGSFRVYDVGGGRWVWRQPVDIREGLGSGCLDLDPPPEIEKRELKSARRTGVASRSYARPMRDPFGRPDRHGTASE